MDHGFLRRLNNNNFHRISERAFRSGQPLPGDLRKYVARHGIRTVVTLRGTKGSLPYIRLMEELCGELGVAFRNFPLNSRRPPRPERVRAARDLLEEIEYPALFHCKSGADRAGLFSALYLHFIEGVPMERTGQLRFWPYGHIRQASTGVLGRFVDAYAAHAREHGTPFLEWVEQVYDREALRAEAGAGGFNWVVDRLLRRE
ncbi:MAG TPA: tyrosine-protein phosphatase [Gammaproteobacteria bacterium]|nr:tyrosine-protein phosphatase [Gammaproteobacteria bacterium]